MDNILTAASHRAQFHHLFLLSLKPEHPTGCGWSVAYRLKSTTGCGVTLQRRRWMITTVPCCLRLFTPRVDTVLYGVTRPAVVFAARCYASAALDVTQCPSIRPSFTFVHSVKTNKHIFKYFLPSGIHSSFSMPNVLAIFRPEPP